MNKAKIKTAKAAARKFLDCANAVEQEQQKDECLFISGSKETGALRRASMDLTRALAELRKPM